MPSQPWEQAVWLILNMKCPVNHGNRQFDWFWRLNAQSAVGTKKAEGHVWQGACTLYGWLEEDWLKNEVKWTEKAGLDRQNHQQYTKHVRLYAHAAVLGFKESTFSNRIFSRRIYFLHPWYPTVGLGWEMTERMGGGNKKKKIRNPDGRSNSKKLWH